MSEATYRHELKFVCSEEMLHLIENRVKQMCKLDTHTGEASTYRIRSIYFDTYDDACLFDNESGIGERHKYRIRIYNNSDKVIKLECKSSVHGLKRKDSCTITRTQCEQIINNRSVEGVTEEQELLKLFLAEKQTTLLCPRVIVEYVRTPYVYPIGNVRITFDRNITSSTSTDFFGEEIPKRNIMLNNMHILEVKYDNILPEAVLWLINGGFSLQRCSFSKYALCRRYSLK